MRTMVIAGLALVVAACSKAEAPPAADTTPVAAAPEPAPLTLESLAGTWNFNVMGMDNDSVLTTHVLTLSADPAGSSFLQPDGEKVAVRDVVVAGDSLTSVAGPFGSGVRKGMKVVDLRTTYRLQDGKLVGVTTAKYEKKSGADSVRQFRLVGTKQ